MKIYILTEQYNDYNQHVDNGYFIRLFRNIPTENDVTDLMSKEEHAKLIYKSSTHEFGCFRWYELIEGNI